MTRMEKRTIQLVVEMMCEWAWVIDVGTVAKYVNDFTPCHVSYEQVAYVLEQTA